MKKEPHNSKFYVVLFNNEKTWKLFLKYFEFLFVIKNDFENHYLIFSVDQSVGWESFLLDQVFLFSNLKYKQLASSIDLSNLRTNLKLLMLNLHPRIYPIISVVKTQTSVHEEFEYLFTKLNFLKNLECLL